MGTSIMFYIRWSGLSFSMTSYLCTSENRTPTSHISNKWIRKNTSSALMTKAKDSRSEPSVCTRVGLVNEWNSCEWVSSWMSEWVHEWVTSCNIAPLVGICILRGLLMHLPRMHVPTARTKMIVQNTGAITPSTDHAIKRGNKVVVILWFLERIPSWFVNIAFTFFPRKYHAWLSHKW